MNLPAKPAAASARQMQASLRPCARGLELRGTEILDLIPMAKV
jgi:hypothetical protein